MKQHHKKSLGFTMMELLVTVAVVAILVALAAPSYSTFIEKRKITGGAEEIAAFMMLARGEAVKHNLPTTVSFNRTSNTVWCMGMVLGTTACDCEDPTPVSCALKYKDSTNTDISETQILSSVNYDGFNLTAATTGAGGDSEFSYDPIRGILANVADTAAFTVQSDNTKYELRVNVSPTGAVKICTNSSKKVTGFKSCS